MIRRLSRWCLVAAFLFAVSGVAALTAGCAEDEVKTEHKKESKTESQPRDSSPGEPIVE